MSTPDWQLPRGVSRSLWEYTQQPEIATGYDASISNSPLSQYDSEFLAHHFPSPGRLIDLGCGTGRHSVAFAQRGFDVLGVDLSAEMLSQLKKKATLANVEVAALRANLCDLSGLPDASFESAILMYATLGMIPAVSDRDRVLRQIHRIVTPGGRLALHIHNYWFNLFDPQGRNWLWNDCWKRWVLGQPGGDRIVHDRGIPNFQMHVFSENEIKSLLRESGFEIEVWQPLNETASGPLQGNAFLSRFRANGWIIIARR